MDHASPRVYVGESRLLRIVSLGLLGCGLVAALVSWPGGPGGLALASLAIGAVIARWMPWHFEVLPEGIELWFVLGRRRFLRRDAVTVRVNPGSPVALLGSARRFGYPLSDGFVERRRAMLRS